MVLPLLASLLALLVGPLLYSRARSSGATALVDGFALVAVGGLVFAHVLPQSFAIAGWAVVPIAILGFLGPGLLCGTHLFSEGAQRVTMPLALLAIGLHAMLDGFALIPSTGTGGEDVGGVNTLALAVILHRIPVGLGIWWLARPLYGVRAALALLGIIAVGSLAGFTFGEPLVGHASQTWVAWFQAFVAGSLLHVILKHPPSLRVTGAERALPSARRMTLASGLGGLIGAALVVGIHLVGRDAHLGHDHETMTASGSTFLQLALQSAPALLFAYAAVAVVHAWMVDIRKILGGGGVVSQAARGTFAGLPLPVCSCGVIPLYRSLVQRRVPTPAAMSFLVATPELGFAALFLSWQLLGGGITLARVAAATVLAFVLGLTVGRRAPLLAPAVDDGDGEALPPWPQRLATGLRYGFGDMVDGTAPWILVGLLVAAVIAPILEPEAFAALPMGLEVPLFALIGMPLYVCASGSTPLVAVLIAKGVSPGAAIAFLLTGPATNVTTFGVLGQLHGRRIAFAFAGAVVALTIGLGYVVDLVMPNAAASAPEVLHDHGGSLLEVACLVALGGVFAVSFLRQGTRGFVGQVISPHGQSEHHGSCCDHEHEHGEGHGDGHEAEHAHDHDHDHEPRAFPKPGSCCGNQPAAPPAEPLRHRN